MYNPKLFFEIADNVRKNSNYKGGTPVGAVLYVNGIFIPATNSYPKGVSPDFLNDLPRKERTQFCNHAEENALIMAAHRGVQTAGGEMFITRFPCVSCISRMIAAGIEKIHFKDEKNLDERWQSRYLFTFENTGVQFYEWKEIGGQLVSSIICGKE